MIVEGHVNELAQSLTGKMLFFIQASGAGKSCPWANLEDIIFTFVSTIQVWP